MTEWMKGWFVVCSCLVVLLWAFILAVKFGDWVDAKAGEISHHHSEHEHPHDHPPHDHPHSHAPHEHPHPIPEHEHPHEHSQTRWTK